ncbi:substrate-binding periplasmic protein [Terasakiella pusilla]|uniref:substrate-binding periplasmic protein n=1 Tax=Terasakiella pusilla TaxID=64973 RepID=UPI003AA95435
MHKLRVSFTLYLLLACFLPLPLLAGQHYVFVGTTFPYILEEGENKQPKGVGVTLLQEISRLTGDVFDIRILPWTRALSLIKRGEVSGLIGPYFSKARQQYLDYAPYPFYEDRMVFVSRSLETVDWNGDFDALKRYNILSIKNWYYGPDFEKARSKLTIYDTISTEGALDMLLHHRADVVALNERNARHLIQRKGMSTVVHINSPHIAINHGYLAYAKNRGEDALHQRMNEALETLYINGEIKRINARFGLSFEQD